MHYDHKIGVARPALHLALGAAAKAVGPEAFIQLLPIKVPTSGEGQDSSWLLTVLRGHIGNATLSFFASYFLPFDTWLLTRSAELEADGRQVEAKNLLNLHEQVWALFPGFCACARDVGQTFGSIARTLGTYLNDKPTLRQPILQGLSLLVLTQRAQKEPVERDGKVTIELSADAQQALDTIGGFTRNFLPIMFNVHQAEPADKRRQLQESIGVLASVSPPAQLSDFFKAALRKMLEAAAGEAEASADTQRGLMDLLISLTPHVGDAQVQLLYRAVRQQLQHPDVLMQKKAYKVVGSIALSHRAFVQANAEDIKAAMAEALPACAPACKGKRLSCLQALVDQLSLPQLQAFSPSLLGEVVLATREVNTKTRGAAFDLLMHLAEQAERRANGGEAERTAAVRSFLVTVAAGLAGNTPHMMAATLSALARLVYELRERPDLVETSAQLFATVLTLLQHKAQEVVRSAIVFCKVALSSLPASEIQPLLPRLVPPMLLWCSNKHAHLKMQVRYLMERLTKRFGHEAMLEVTPEAHHRLLTHIRKQKVRGQNHAAARVAEREGRQAANGTSRGSRHSDFEALVEAGGDEEEDMESELTYAKRSTGAAIRQTWKDGGDVIDLLTAPQVSETARARPPGGRSLKIAGGKRRREEEDNDDVTVDDSGKIAVLTSESGVAATPQARGFAGGAADMEVDPLDEIVRPGAAKRRRGLAQQKVEASAAEIEDATPSGGQIQLGRKAALAKARRAAAVDNFGASMGDKFKSKKGAAGDIMTPGGQQPFAYLPLNPRLLGKKQQRNAAATMNKLVSNKSKGGVKVRQARAGKHGIQARRGRSQSRK